MRGFTKIKKKHLLKISAIYLIGKAEICQDPPSWSQDDQTLLWNLTKFQLIQLIQTIVNFIFSIVCLIELKLCEVSRNSFSNRCWKFQLSILKNKKVLFLKKYFLSHCQYQNKKALFADPIFSEGFALEVKMLLSYIFANICQFLIGVNISGCQFNDCVSQSSFMW